ncbi:biopolymer transporter ExbD [Oleiharenicola lentus]|jgi:biopolymer transport protein ExbD|uniref:Biopolymer transporter ExbD n=1 Tax=Oleiharenicola lentus TaxID=2508720 RepID=A0A4Q1CAS9_9BACT|nr:biopolymer transporter ExbD [Oleiharenicola lentus]RXK56006.1 biopolymer transporter ExbD [Oleiharenicola lentus]
MSGLLLKRRRRPELNLLPLIDVLVMLVFFAFVTMQFRSMTTMNLTLPKVETAGKSEIKDSLTISITKDGGVEVNGRPASMQLLEQLVQEIGRVSKDVTVVIRSDENTPLRYVTQAMDTCRKQGLNKIRLQSR